MEPNNSTDLVEEFYLEMKRNQALEMDFNEEVLQVDEDVEQYLDDNDGSYDEEFEDEGEDSEEEIVENVSAYDKVLQQMNELLDPNTNEPTEEHKIEKPVKHTQSTCGILEPISEPQFTVLKNIWQEHK